MPKGLCEHVVTVLSLLFQIQFKGFILYIMANLMDTTLTKCNINVDDCTDSTVLPLATRSTINQQTVSQYIQLYFYSAVASLYSFSTVWFAHFALERTLVVNVREPHFLEPIY